MRRAVLALILLVSPAVLAAQEYAEIKTPEFTLITDAGEAKGRELAEHFEQLRASFGIFFNKESMTVPLPLTVIAFRNSRDFQPFVPKVTDKTRAPWPGAVRNGEDESLIAFDLSAERHPNAVLTGLEFADREYVRLLINGNFPQVPAWYDDGVLEYCAALRVTNKQLIYGLPQQDLMAVLQSQPWMRIVQFFGPIPPSPPQDWEAQRKTIFYAQAWITMHYLMASRLGRQLNAFVDLVQTQHLDTQEAIRRAFGVEPPAFENAVRNYVTMGPTEYKLTLPADFGKASYETRKLREADWLAAEADLHVHSARDHDLGVEMFTKVLAIDPRNATAQRGLGYSYLQHNDFDIAESYLEKALAADSADPRTHYFLALLAYKKSRVGGTEPDLAAMKQHLEKAVAFYPEYADAYQLLSWAESELKNADAAHAAIQKASDLAPRNDLYALTSAQFDLQAKQYDKARPVLERLQGSSEAEVARFAHQALSNMGQQKQETMTRYSAREQITAPQWREPEKPPQDQKPATTQKPAESTTQQKIEYMKGEVVSVDCSHAPVAALNFASKGKRWVLVVPDVKKLMLIGVENFSCDWMNQKASVNYRLRADGKGELISLEID